MYLLSVKSSYYTIYIIFWGANVKEVILIIGLIFIILALVNNLL